MAFLNSIRFTFITPFSPKRVYFKLLSDGEKKANPTIALIFCLILLLALNIIKLNMGIQHQLDYQFYNTLGFITGFGFRFFLKCYLILLIYNRSKIAKVTWPVIYSISAFALFPYVLALLLGLIYFQHPTLISMVAFLWNGLIISTGLKMVYEVSILKTLGFLLIIKLIYYLLMSSFFGIPL